MTGIRALSGDGWGYGQGAAQSSEDTYELPQTWVAAEVPRWVVWEGGWENRAGNAD